MTPRAPPATSRTQTVKQDEINTKLAAINYGYTSVTAPYDGIVTARQVSVGDYVGGTVDADRAGDHRAARSDLRQFQHQRAGRAAPCAPRSGKRGLTPADLKKVPVEVGLQTEEGYPHKGTLDYASPTVDASTGTLAARAVLENPNRVLLPGMFVRVRVPTGKLDNALLVPETALGTDQGGRYLLIVGKDDVVEQRSVDGRPARRHACG